LIKETNREGQGGEGRGGGGRSSIQWSHWNNKLYHHHTHSTINTAIHHQKERKTERR